MVRVINWLCAVALLLAALPAFGAPRPCTADSECFSPGETCVSSFCQAKACGNDQQCGAGSRCVATHCVPACTADSDCTAGQACFAGSACLPVTAVTLPNRFGLVSSGQPSCQSNLDCQASVDCVAPLGGGASHCRIVRSAPGAPVSFATCGNVNFSSASACPAASSYGCGPLEGGSHFCESTATCTTQAECESAYPVSGLRCLFGRCSSECNAATPCAGAAQSTCFESPSLLNDGMCVASTFQARLFTYHLGRLNPDSAQSLLGGQRNLVFVSDGFLAGNLSAFSNYAAEEIARLTDNVDVVSPLFASLFNLFVLEVSDNASGLGQPTRFGYFEGAASTTGDMPGSGDQAFFFTNSALEQWSTRFGPTPTGSLTQSVVFYNTGASTRAHGGGGLIVQPISDDRDFTLSHEFGHMLGALSDEYVADSDVELRKNIRPFEEESAGVTEACTFNVISRRLLTGCVHCDGDDDSSLPIPGTNLQRAPWFPFLNESNALNGQFSTNGDNALKTSGLFVGAGARFETEWIRPNAISFMRDQQEAPFFGRASVEGWARVNVSDGDAATIRWVPLLAPEPTELSNGPLQAVAVSSKAHRAFYTLQPGAGASNALAVVSGITLAHEHTIVLSSAPGAETPRVLLVDDPRDRLLMRSRSVSTPAESKLIIVNTAALTASNFTVPDLFGFPGVDPSTGAIYVQTRNGSGDAFLVKIQDETIEALDAPLQQPFFSSLPQVSVSQSLMFLTAGSSVLDNPFCDAAHCEIWAIDLATQALLPGRLSVDMTGEAVPPAIQLATIGRRADGTELLIVASSTRIRGWDVAELKEALLVSSILAPSFELTHTLAAGDVPLAGLGFVAAPTERVILGNRAGQLALFTLDAAAPESIVLDQLRPGMQILGVQTAPSGSGAAGFAVVTAGAFDGPRNGVVAVLDLATATAALPPGRGRIVFEQPLAAAGLSAPGADWDSDWGLIYTTGVVDVGPVGQGNRFQTPVVRGPAGLRYQGCLSGSL